MRSKRGVTMLGLVIYVTSFLVVTGIVAGITSFFYGNESLMTEELYSAADFNKLNLYLVKESEQKGNRVEEIVKSNDTLNPNVESSNSSYHIKFKNGDVFTFDEVNNLLYYNSVCLCEGVKGFEGKIIQETSKEVLSVKVQFENKSYTCKYTMEQ